MEKLKKQNLSDLVYEQISNMILNGDLKPGDKLNRNELATTLGVSHTPINEAILRFVNEGVVDQQNRKGFYLKIFTNKDMQELYAVRAGLEGVALRSCVKNKGPEEMKEILSAFDGFSLPLSRTEYERYRKQDRYFHEQILLSSENSIIIDFVKNFDFIMKCYQKGLLRSPDETLPEHLIIIETIRQRKAEKAQNLIMAHHLKTKDYITQKNFVSTQ